MIELSNDAGGVVSERSEDDISQLQGKKKFLKEYLSGIGDLNREYRGTFPYVFRVTLIWCTTLSAKNLPPDPTTTTTLSFCNFLVLWILLTTVSFIHKGKPRQVQIQTETVPQCIAIATSGSFT